MLNVLMMAHLVMIPYIVWQVRSHSLPAWLGCIYFYFLGLALVALSFSIVNLLFSLISDGEGQAWFGFFAFLGGVGAAALGTIAAVFTGFVYKRLSWRPWMLGALAVVAIEVVVLVYTSRYPRLNWW